MSERRIIVHSLAHAEAALAAAAGLRRNILLMSAPGAGCAMGPRWFLALVADARQAVREAEADCVLDCADEPGMALAALRAGARRVRFTGSVAVRAKLADIAAASGAVIEHEPAASLDLLDARDAYALCRDYLQADGD